MSQVPGYDLLVAVGKGGAAEVWRARRQSDGVEVAVKLGHAATAHARKRFEVEAEALGRVGSPHALELLDRGVAADGRPFLVLELANGGTLADVLAHRSGPCGLDEIAGIGSAVLSALQAVHDAGLVHRDLKPANIVIFGQPVVASLMDFGLALGTDAADVTRAGVGVGTPKYVAPEQLRADTSIDRRADLYSFGVLLYQLATHTLPFDGAPDAVEYGHLTLRPPAPGKRAAMPARLEALIIECLAKDPDDRPTSADRVGQLLRAACAPGDVARTADAVTSRVPVRRTPSGRESIALLSCEAAVRSLAVVESVVRRGGFLIANRGPRFLFGFAADSVDSPALAASYAARELSAELADSIAVHLDTVDLVRSGSAVPMVAGAAIANPGAWLPLAPWVGVVVTQTAARALPGARPDAVLTDFSRLEPERDGGELAPIIGRDDALSSARAGAAACFAAGTPHTWTLVAEAGMGKTRIARQIASDLKGQGIATVFVSGRDGDAIESIAADVRTRAQGAPVALVVDDLHRATNRTLDRIEYISVEQRSVSLWIAATTSPELQTIRPGWGKTAGRAVSFLLPPMKETAAMELAARWLEPAEYPAAEVLRTLVRWAGCVPASLEELARTLRREGFIRPRGQGESYYLATPELSAVESSPVIEWLASRARADLPASLAELLEICAALEPPFAIEEVDWIQRAIEAEDPERDVADAKAGIAELCNRGSVRRRDSDGELELTSSLVAQGVEQLLHPALRRRIHHHAAEHFRARVEAAPDESSRWHALARAARHAAESGDDVQAAAAYLELGRRQLGASNNMDAELAFSRALELASEAGGDVALAALLGRGRVRYRIDRVADALADLAELRELAGSVGDAGRIAEALLEEAAAFDWAEQFDESESALSQAAPLVDQLGDAALSAQLLAARGRSHWRMSRPEQAVEQLARAAAADCDEARTIAATLLPLALLRCGRLDESEAQFSQAIELFESRGDLFHLAAILVNRMFLWSARQDPDRGRSDLRRAIEIARELGNPQLERGAVYNLAEDLYWSGIDDESLELAERARALRRKFWPEVVPIDELLLARIQAGQSDFDSARASLAETGWVQSAGAADSFSLLGAAVDRAVSSARWDVWEPLIEAADRALGADEALEVRYLCARSLLRNGQTDRVAAVVTGAGPGLARAPIWKRRFAALV